MKMELKELLEKAREFNGMIKTPEDLLNHLQRVQTCCGCGLDYYDKICPTCRDNLETQSEPNGNQVKEVKIDFKKNSLIANNTQQDERARRGNLDSTSDGVTCHASQSTSNKRDMGNPAGYRKGCGKILEGSKDFGTLNCGDILGMQVGSIWVDDEFPTLCPDCTTSHEEASHE